MTIYRAKRKDADEFVQGSLVHNTKTNEFKILVLAENKEEPTVATYHSYPVITESIAVSTLRKDKNDNTIFMSFPIPLGASCEWEGITKGGDLVKLKRSGDILWSVVYYDSAAVLLRRGDSEEDGEPLREEYSEEIEIVGNQFNKGN